MKSHEPLLTYIRIPSNTDRDCWAILQISKDDVPGQLRYDKEMRPGQSIFVDGRCILIGSAAGHSGKEVTELENEIVTMKDFSGIKRVSPDLIPITSHAPLSAVQALIDKIRSGPPEAIAPEIYGLSKVLDPEPANTVLELCGQTHEGLSKTYPEDGWQPRPGESFRDWSTRTAFNIWSDGSPEASRAAYTAIGYDWVDWKWLPPGHSPLNMPAPDPFTGPAFVEDDIFVEGIEQQDEPCPYEDGTESDLLWHQGRDFARSGGFERVTAILSKLHTRQAMNSKELSVFAKPAPGECVHVLDPRIVAAATSLESTYPEAREMLKAYKTSELVISQAAPAPAKAPALAK